MEASHVGRSECEIDQSLFLQEGKRSFEVSETLSRWAHLTLFDILQALTNTLLGISASGDVEESLILMREGRRGPLRLIGSLHEVAGIEHGQFRLEHPL